MLQLTSIQMVLFRIGSPTYGGRYTGACSRNYKMYNAENNMFEGAVVRAFP